jgi:hypothetical protein
MKLAIVYTTENAAYRTSAGSVRWGVVTGHE